MSFRLAKYVGDLLRAGDRLLLPPRCAFCQADYEPTADGILLCHGCRQVLVPPQGPSCRQCGELLPLLQSPEKNSCPRCASEQWYFDTVFPLGQYREELRVALLRTKHAAEESLLRALAQLLLQRHGQILKGFQPDAIVPIPLHWTRYIARGLNGAESIARQLARGLKIRCEPSLLRRIRRTQKQSTLSRSQRSDNLRGAIVVSSAFELKDAKILLVDDILTTGTTCNEAAKVLRKAGSTQIAVTVLARASESLF